VSTLTAAAADTVSTKVSLPLLVTACALAQLGLPLSLAAGGTDAVTLTKLATLAKTAAGAEACSLLALALNTCVALAVSLAKLPTLALAALSAELFL